MPKATKNSRTLSDSPLLNNDAESSVLHSTIHPERLDMSRFSDRMIEEEEEGSPLRIIIYVVVVIAIGVGLALGVRYLISQNNNQQNNNNNNQQPTTTGNETPQGSELIKVNTTALADNTAQNAPADDSFGESETTVVGTGLVAGTKAALQEINYQKYTTFVRITFTFKDLGANNEVPSAIWGFQPNNNRITIAFDRALNMPTSGINPTTNINDLARDVTANLEDKEFMIQFTKPIEYRVAVVSNTMVLDVREKGTTTPTTDGSETPTGTDTTADGSDSTDGEDTTTDTTGSDNGGGSTTGTTTTGGTPTSNNYTNEFSQNPQTISNTKISGNVMAYNETFFGDTGPFFEIAFGERYKLGDTAIPNAKAEYVTTDGKTYIKLTIQNLASFEFTDIQASDMPQINLENANFVGAKRESFSNGTAVVMIEVKKKSNFKLLSEPTLSGQTQVTAIQIQD